jgi:hypothetical protein
MTSAKALFLIYALPRSRTQWLSEFLSVGDSHCFHDLSIKVPDAIETMLAHPSRVTGNSDDGLLFRRVPDVPARILCVLRPLAEVEASLARTGIAKPDDLKTGAQFRKLLDLQNAHLQVIAKTFPAVHYEDINREAENIFRYLTGRNAPSSHVETWLEKRINLEPKPWFHVKH